MSNRISERVRKKLENFDENQISNVSETLFPVLAARAKETQSKDPIIEDWYAVEICKVIERKFNLKIPSKLNVSIGLRTKAFDNYIVKFMNENPNGIIINLGCGLDTRFYRFDNGTINWYEIDFPEVIKLKEMLLEPSERYHLIGSSVMDFDWIKLINYNEKQKVLIYAEGLFMYLKEHEVRELLDRLSQSFPNCHLVFENCNKYWVDKMQSGGYVKVKFQRRFKLEKDVVFNWGVSESSELEHWNPKFKLIEENIYLAEKHKKWGVIKYFLKNPKLIKIMWIIYYTL